MSEFQTASETELQSGELSDAALGSINGGATALGALAKAVATGVVTMGWGTALAVSALMSYSDGK